MLGHLVRRPAHALYLILTLAAMLVGATALAPAAQAGEGDYLSRIGYVDYGPDNRFTTNFQANWSRQGDGTGVVIERFKAQTPRGCADLEDGDGGTKRYQDVQVFSVVRNENIKNKASANYTGCTIYKDVRWRGRDRGGIDLRFTAQARIDNGYDRVVFIGLSLRPNGTSTVDYAFDDPTTAKARRDAESMGAAY